MDDDMGTVSHNQPGVVRSDSISFNWRKRFWVYFIRPEGRPFIKVGSAQQPYRRMVDLQVASPEVLILLAVEMGGPKHERELHATYTKHRVRGEWFDINDQLLDRIESLGPPPPCCAWLNCYEMVDDTGYCDKHDQADLPPASCADKKCRERVEAKGDRCYRHEEHEVVVRRMEVTP